MRIALLTLLLVGFTGVMSAQEPSPSEPRRDREAKTAPEPRETNAPRAQEETKPRPQEEKAQPSSRQETAKPPREQSKPAHEPAAHAGQHGKVRPAGKSAHIPEPQFKAHFGRQHAFTVKRVINQTTIVPGQTRFVLVGYTFVFLDPWPAEWLFTDECYIDYVDDEYFLFDGFHPGIRVALFVVG